MYSLLHKVQMLRWVPAIWSQSPSHFPGPAHHFFAYLPISSPSPYPPQDTHPAQPPFALLCFAQLPVEVASLLSNSVWRLKGGNYIHAAWPLWTLSRPLPRLLTGNWFKGPHWHLRDGSRELWKCQKAFAMCVHVCVCLPRQMLDTNIPWWRIL